MNEDNVQNQGSALPQPIIGSQAGLEEIAADAAVIGSICLTLNAAGNILSSDRQSADFLGYDWNVLIGQPIAVLVHLQDQARLYTELTEALRPAANPVQATLQPLYTSQFCLVCKDGRCLEVQAIGHILQGETTLIRLECLPLTTRSPVASPLIPSQLSDRLGDRLGDRSSAATPLKIRQSRYPALARSRNFGGGVTSAEELQQQIERQRLISTIAQRIRASLDLNTILNSTVEEVRQFLQTDRVLIYRFEPDWSGKIIVESVAAPWTAVLGSSFQDPCFTANHIDRYRQGRIQVVADIYAAGLNQCHIDLLASLQVRANLVVPIVSQDLWGLLIAQHCREPRQWETLTIELLKQLATQVGIAVHQAELHNQVQRLNTHLEFQVKERTAQLQQALNFEAVLRRITEKVRDSLDESQILQAATQELAQVLQIHRCEVELYNPLHTTVAIAYAYVGDGVTDLARDLARDLASEPSTIASRPIADYLEIYTPLLAGRTMQFVEGLSGSLELATLTRLACPICDDQGILGNLWLERSRGEYFDDFEIQLVEQVADQCAIAMRQARLYEAAQTQVEALEKFISLKDEFLANVSHELCTPMSSIHLAAQTLEKLLTEAGGAATQNPIVGRTLAILKQECQREMRVINNLLTLSYADGEERLAPTLIDFRAWLPQIIEPFRSLVAQRQQNFQVTIAEDLPLLELDLVYLERILNELLNNACKYTPATGAIEISVLGLPTELQISVTNSSVPMSDEALTHLFEKFYRVPDSSVWEYGGAGLGLAVVKKLVERLQARIEVTNADRQMTFRLRFPIRA